MQSNRAVRQSVRTNRTSRRSIDSSERNTSENVVEEEAAPQEDEVVPIDNGAGGSGSSTEDATDGQKTPNYEVEQVIDKKIYKGETYYKLKWLGWDEPTWELAKNCSCDLLIDEYEKRIIEQSKDEDEDEWEVEEILQSRQSKNETEYLVRWKNWDGEPEWVNEKQCTCVNLIAAYENPKLRKMWNFQGSNTKLWLNREAMMRYMRKYARLNNYKVNLLKFESDFPMDEEPLDTIEGLNMGPLCYKNHWYLVIVLINYICITRKILICDPLNTLIGVPNTRVHPVYKRMTKVYKNFTVTPISMTPMERSDMCAFYVLAAYERGLFCLDKSASFIVNKLYFDHSRPELIRAQTAPRSDHEISVNLLNNGCFLDGPKCEFCGFLGETGDTIDRHIKDEHFTLDQIKPPESPDLSPAKLKYSERKSPANRKRSATGIEVSKTPKRFNNKSVRRVSSS